MSPRPWFTSTLLSVLLATSATAETGSDNNDSRNLADLSIRELMEESVTSVARKEQRFADAPAAIYVLTAEDIRRAGHPSIPEALRMVPGLSVARLDSHTWIITARGFAAQWAGKLLVLMDGRTVYDPFHSGVGWSVQDTPLEDVDRIEVIRGPGASVWGANAVNGVINIITKKAQDTQGGLATLNGGTQQRGGAIRYGGQAGSAYYRAYLKYDDYSNLASLDGYAAVDGWRMWRGGFRVDGELAGRNVFTLQGDLYGGQQNRMHVLTSLTPPYSGALVSEDAVSGGNILGRWTHSVDEHSNWSLQAYYDRTVNPDPALDIKRNTADVEFQHQLELGSRQALVYGTGYRLTCATYGVSFWASYPRRNDCDSLASAFVQDDVALLRHELVASLGSKFERNDFTGFEFQPSVRLLWTPNRKQSVWASLSRAVRTPNRWETALRLNTSVTATGGPGATGLVLNSTLPNDALDSERVLAREIGWRFQTSRRIYFDVAAFANSYEGLVVSERFATVLETDPAPAHLTSMKRRGNLMGGDTFGIELAPSWQVADWWRLSGAYTWLQMNLRSAAVGQTGQTKEGDSPGQQLQVRSFMQWRPNFSFAAELYYVDSLSNQGVPSYLRLDMRFAWCPTDNVDASIGGTNLLDERHAEFRNRYAVVPQDARRGIYGKLIWHF
jgi:iron complex outermembrane receptor protein